MSVLKYLLGLALVLHGLQLSAQLNGKVVEIDAKGDTVVIPGAIVFWDKTTTASATDENGNFSISTTPQSQKLGVKAIGFEDRFSTIKDSTKFVLLILKKGVDLSEVEVVYYSTGTDISYLNPMKVEVLNERSLMKAACCNLSESFETNPSIDVNFADAVSGAKQIQMLGLSGQYAQITKENMPYLRGLANNYGLSFIPGTWIQSIQLSKGAGSVVNGYESFTGQINTELQNPENSDQLHFNSYLNQNGRNEYNLNLRRKLTEKFSAGILSHVSFNPLLQDMNMDGFADIPAGRQYNFANKYSYQDPKSGFEAQFGGAYLKDERDGGQIKKMMESHHDTMPLYRIGLQNQKWEVYSKTGYVFANKPGTSMGLQLSYLDHDQQNSYGSTRYTGDQKTFYANYIFQGIIGSTNHTYKTGASFMHDDVKENYSGRAFKRLEKVGGVFTEYAYNYKEKFNLVAGLRADQHNYYGLFFTPRLHLRYAFTPNSVLRLSGGRALRTANIFTDNSHLMASSRTWMIITSDNSNPYGLNPETGWNYGFNFTQKFKLNYREAYITIDAYRTDFISQVVTDIDASPQSVVIYNLRGPSYSNSLQFEFNMEPRKRLHMKTAYRYVDSKTTFSRGLLQKPMVSMHRAFVNLSYETRDKHWQFDFTTQYNGSKRLPVTTTNPAEYRLEETSPAYFNLLGQITWLTHVFDGNFHIYAGVENLLNYKQKDPIVSADEPFSPYFDASMVWGPIYGRMFYAGLRLKFK